MCFEDGAATVLATPLLDSPLYEAGVDRGDRIVSVGGRPVPDRDAFEAILAAHGPGDEIGVRFESRGEVFDVAVTLVEDPTLATGLTEEGATEAEAARRAAWKAARSAGP